MDDDMYLYDMFQELMQQLDDGNDTGRMRVLSKEPRHAADDPAAIKIKTEKR